MEALFLKLLNMSITASWMIMAVVILRVVLKNAPKFIRCILWGLVAIRLICPVSFESILSLIPSTKTVKIGFGKYVSFNISTGVSVLDKWGKENLSGYCEKIMVVSDPVKYTVSITDIVFIVSMAWLIGVVFLALYSILIYVKIRHKVVTSMNIEDNVWICDGIKSPFVLGIFKPRIYIPSTTNEQERKYIMAHEKVHLKRLDYIWKPMGFLILSVYWFNPFIWVAYMLFCRDIEFACDEQVVQYMNEDDKKEYSRTLLACSSSHKIVDTCPVALGEVAVKKRVKSVMNYKKPEFGIVSTAIVACIVVAVCFLTNPKQASVISDDPEDIPYENKVAYHNENSNRVISLSIDTERFYVFSAPRFDTNGTYTIKNDKLIMQSDDGDLVLVFEILEGKLVFDINASEYDEKLYKFKENEEFIRPTFDNGVYKDNAPNTGYECVIADADNDGKEERCFIGDGWASGPVSYAIAVMENGNVEAYSVFYPEYEEWTIDKDKDGKVIVKTESRYTDSGDDEIQIYEVIVKDGNIVLSGEKDTIEGREGKPAVSYPF